MQRRGVDTEPHDRPDGSPVHVPVCRTVGIGVRIGVRGAVRIGVRSTVGCHGALRLVV